MEEVRERMFLKRGIRQILYHRGKKISGTQERGLHGREGKIHKEERRAESPPEREKVKFAGGKNTTLKRKGRGGCTPKMQLMKGPFITPRGLCVVGIKRSRKEGRRNISNLFQKGGEQLMILNVWGFKRMKQKEGVRIAAQKAESWIGGGGISARKRIFL